MSNETKITFTNDLTLLSNEARTIFTNPQAIIGGSKTWNYVVCLIFELCLKNTQSFFFTHKPNGIQGYLNKL